MKRQYRVWTIDQGKTCTCHTDWRSYTACRAYIFNFWLCWPSGVYVSQARDVVSFRRVHSSEFRQPAKFI